MVAFQQLPADDLEGPLAEPLLELFGRIGGVSHLVALHVSANAGQCQMSEEHKCVYIEGGRGA